MYLYVIEITLKSYHRKLYVKHTRKLLLGKIIKKTTEKLFEKMINIFLRKCQTTVCGMYRNFSD